MTTKTTAGVPAEIIGDREAARLAKHWLALDEKRLELGRSVSLLEKEQEAIKAKIELYVLDRSPKERVVRLAKAVLRVATVSSCRFIGWKGVCVERLGQAVVAEIEANPPSRDVVRIEHNTGGTTAASGTATAATAPKKRAA